MKVSYLGTTMLLFDDGRDQLLFDCHVTRPSLMKCVMGKIETDKAVSDRVIKEFDITRLRGIFISHSHHDHVLDAPYFALQCGADLYGSPSSLNVARGGGVGEECLHSYVESMRYQIGDFTVGILPSVHSKAHWYNNDLGKTIDAPLVQPAKKAMFREGGSFDFLITHRDKRYLIRPSYNYLEDQLDGLSADVLFLGIGGLSKDSEERQKAFFAETIQKAKAKTVIPVHWDNFFAPLYGEIKAMPGIMDNMAASMGLLTDYCRRNGVCCIVQLPLTSIML